MAGSKERRAAAYVRVSSEEQTEGHSLDAQRRAIQQACADRGWQIVEWYADEGISAHTDDIARRPAFHQMIEDAKQRRFDAVIVHKLDRFARSVVVALGTFKLLNDLGITFLSLSESGMDFTTPMGKVMFGMLAILAEYYSENLGLETKKGKAERRAKGLHNGLVPFGYRSDAGALAEPDPDTREGAVLAFQMAADGSAIAQIAQALNQRGYTTAGNMRRGAFTKDTVRDMLANQFYLGKLPVFEPGSSRRIRDWTDGRHAAIIDAATFEAARAAIQGRARSVHAQRRNATVYSLSGLLRCAHCGERMRAVRTENGRVRYHCRTRLQGLSCPGKGSFLDVYAGQVVEDLSQFELPDDWKATILAEASRDAGREPDSEAQRRRLDGRLERLKELYGWGDITREQYQAERAQIERELAQLQPADARPDVLGKLAGYLDSLPRAWADATESQRNALLNVLYDDVWVSGPAVAYVSPRPEFEPLFQVRAGAAQPVAALGTVQRDGNQFPESHRGRHCQHLYCLLTVSPPATAGTSRRLSSTRTTDSRPSLTPTDRAAIPSRVAAGASLRTLARDYGVSYETVRRASLVSSVSPVAI